MVLSQDEPIICSTPGGARRHLPLRRDEGVDLRVRDEGGGARARAHPGARVGQLHRQGAPQGRHEGAGTRIHRAPRG